MVIVLFNSYLLFIITIVKNVILLIYPIKYNNNTDNSHFCFLNNIKIEWIIAIYNK